jgi:myo-inositol-1-phosphate synthase
VAGPLIGPSAYLMKSPPVQFSDDAAREMVEEFILGNGISEPADWTAFFDADGQGAEATVIVDRQAGAGAAAESGR